MPLPTLPRDINPASVGPYAGMGALFADPYNYGLDRDAVDKLERTFEEGRATLKRLINQAVSPLTALIAGRNVTRRKPGRTEGGRSRGRIARTLVRPGGSNATRTPSYSTKARPTRDTGRFRGAPGIAGPLASGGDLAGALGELSGDAFNRWLYPNGVPKGLVEQRYDTIRSAHAAGSVGAGAAVGAAARAAQRVRPAVVAAGAGGAAPPRVPASSTEVRLPTGVTRAPNKDAPTSRGGADSTARVPRSPAPRPQPAPDRVPRGIAAPGTVPGSPTGQPDTLKLLLDSLDRRSSSATRTSPQRLATAGLSRSDARARAKGAAPTSAAQLLTGFNPGGVGSSSCDCTRTKRPAKPRCTNPTLSRTIDGDVLTIKRKIVCPPSKSK